MTNEEDLEETTGGGFKRPEPEEKKNGKVKKFFKSVGKKTGEGAKATGGFVSKKVGESIKAAKERRTPEAKLEKIKAKKEILKARQELVEQRQSIATQRASLRKTQLKSTGINAPKFVRGTQELGIFASGGGMAFKPLDMANVLGGGGSGGDLPNMDLGNVLSGNTRVAPRKVLKKFRTVKSTRRIRIKRGKSKGKFRTKTTRRRVNIQQPKVFNPYNQL